MQRERVPLSHEFRGRWREVLGSIGVPTDALINRHGPCPVCGGVDRFRFDDKEGLGTFICSRCGPGDGPMLAMLFLGLNFADLAARVRQTSGAASSPTVNLQRVARAQSGQGELSEAKRHQMNVLWHAADPVRPVDPVGAYLTRRIGRTPAGVGLRYHPNCRHSEGGDHPAMLARFLGPDGIPTGLHRTYVTPAGAKAPVSAAKQSLGKLVRGGAVRLAPIADRLGIAEGIETALAVTELFGLPCWAALNANGLAHWQPPPGVREVVIFGDNDASFTGQTAAFDLMAHLGPLMKVEIEIPTAEDTDWNDVLNQRLRIPRLG